MSISAIVLLLTVNNFIQGFESVHRATKTVYPTFEEGTNSGHEDGNITLKKYKRWIPATQDVVLDYPELDESIGEPLIAQLVTPSSSGAGTAGNVLYYRPGSQRPHGAVTRTVYNPPSGLIPRMIAAAKAAFATLTGPQTILSKTTYLRPPRPAIGAILPAGLQSQAVSPEQGLPSTNAATAAAAAAAAVAAITRSLYEAAAHRESGIIIDKRNPFMTPPQPYNPYGTWSEPPRTYWNTYQPAELTVRFPQEPYGHHLTTHRANSQAPLPLSSYLPYGYPNPSTSTEINIEPPKNAWYDATFNSQDSSYGLRESNPGWSSYGKTRSAWSQDSHREMKDIWTEKKTSLGRAPSGVGGFAEASADTPPNGDSFADAKVTSHGASAVAAAVWSRGSLEGMRNSFFDKNKRSGNDNAYDQSSDVVESKKSLGLDIAVNDNRFSFLPNMLPSQGHEMMSRTEGRKSADRVEDGEASHGELSQLKCSKSDECFSPKNHSDRLRIMFPSKRKQKYT